MGISLNAFSAKLFSSSFIEKDIQKEICVRVCIAALFVVEKI